MRTPQRNKIQFLRHGRLLLVTSGIETMNHGNIVQSWYPLASSSALPPGKAIKLELFDLRLVLFRTRLGKLGLVDRNCSHMGGDLSNGVVTNEGIQCPIHQWEFLPTGAVAGSNVLGLNPVQNPCQNSFQCEEANGIVHGYFGGSPAFALPKAGDDVFMSRVEIREINLSYDIPSVFGFDSEHFETVHKRGIDELTVYQHHDRHLGTRVVASVDGLRLGDRIMRLLGVTEVKLDIDFLGANILFGQHLHSNTFAYIAGLPIDRHRTRMYVSIMQSRPKRKSVVHSMLGWLRFQIAKPATRAFISQDERALVDVRFDRHSLSIAPDSQVHEWLTHYDSLPRLREWRDHFQ